METILGDEPAPTEAECETIEAMRARILATPYEAAQSYDGAAEACARIIIEALEQYPVLTSVPTETIYLRHDDERAVLVNSRGDVVEDFGAGVLMVPISTSLYDVLKILHPEGTPQCAVFMELTGFMWGWAMNAARRCARVPGVELGQVPNPAMLEVSR